MFLMSPAKKISTLILFTLFYYLTNPYWYGDAVWYATELKTGNWPTDPGHLFWRPIANFFLKALNSIGLTPDALNVYRSMSAMLAAGSILGIVTLSYKVGLNKSQTTCAALILGFSHFNLAYAGSGSAYCGAVCFTLWSFVLLFRADLKGIILAAVLFTLACSTWLVSALLLPALLLLPLLFWHSDSKPLRGSITLFLLVSALLSVVFLSAHALSSDPNRPFLEWVRSSGHEIPLRLSVINLARGFLGCIISFIYLGDFGFQVKQFALAEPLQEFNTFAVYACLVGVFLLLVVTALISVPRRIKNKSQLFRTIAFASAIFLPVFGFAILWQGSDIERFCLALPILALLISYAAESDAQSWSRRWLLPGFIAVVNLGLLIVPMLYTSGGLVTQLGAVAKEKMGSNVLLVLTGQELGPRVWSSTIYLHSIDVHSVIYDVQSFGEEGWDRRLDRSIRKKFCSAGHVAVLKDLLGVAVTRGLSSKEFPIPTFEQTKAALSAWSVGAEWQVGKFTFVEISTLGTNLDCTRLSK